MVVARKDRLVWNWRDPPDPWKKSPGKKVADGDVSEDQRESAWRIVAMKSGNSDGAKGPG